MGRAADWVITMNGCLHVPLRPYELEAKHASANLTGPRLDAVVQNDPLYSVVVGRSHARPSILIHQNSRIECGQNRLSPVSGTL
ncbi:MAG: hypothetical protein CMH52_06930 [Myxococcales bacterium]|nr:hypothetical protein [Myxococcales bacterium]